MGFNRQCSNRFHSHIRVFLSSQRYSSSPEVMASVFPGCCPRLTASLPGRVGRRASWSACPAQHTHLSLNSPTILDCVLCPLHSESFSVTLHKRRQDLPLRGRFPGTGLQKSIAKVQPSLTGPWPLSRAAPALCCPWCFENKNVF